MADPVAVDRLALPDKIKDLLRPAQLPPPPPVAESIVEAPREPDGADSIFGYRPELERSKVLSHPDISQHLVEMAGAIHAGRIDPTLPSATPEQLANILLQAHRHPETPAVIPSKVLIDGAELDWNDSRALTRVQEVYISASRVEQMIDDYRRPENEEHQLGTTFATGTALNEYLRARIGEAIPVLLHTHDEGHVPALIRMNEAGGVSVWGPYFKGPSGAPFGKSDTDGLIMTASVPTSGLSRADVKFDRVTLLRSDIQQPPWNEGDSLTVKRSWDELRGILPNELGVCFGTTQTLEILGEGNEIAGASGSPAEVAQTIIGAGHGRAVDYPEFLVLRDGTTVPTCSRRGLIELAVRTQEAYESQSLVRLQQVAAGGAIHTIDELKAELNVDRDHAIGLCVRPHSSSDGLHAIMLRSTESGFVVFDPNYPGEHRAVLVQTSDVESMDGKSTEGAVMIRYSVEGGREIWATVTGVLRKRVSA